MDLLTSAYATSDADDIQNLRTIRQPQLDDARPSRLHNHVHDSHARKHRNDTNPDVHAHNKRNNAPALPAPSTTYAHTYTATHATPHAASTPHNYLITNPHYDALYAPVHGPAHSHAEPRQAASGGAPRFLGHAAPAAIASDHTFNEQLHTFNVCGYAANPSLAAGSAAAAAGSAAAAAGSAAAAGGPAVVGNATRWAEAHRGSVYSRKAPLASVVAEQRKRLRLDELDESAPQRAGGGSSEETLQQQPSPAAASTAAAAAAGSNTAAATAAVVAAELKSAASVQQQAERTIFHGASRTDYQGRSWLAPPPERKLEEHECFAPKKWVHTWSGHTKGVAAIRWFPGNGHLLLSVGMDAKVKIWDVFGSRACMQTYMGHTAAVRDACFTNDGRRFVTASYDRFLKLWDTETGKCISAFSNNKVPYVAKLHPDADQQNVLLAGCASKQVVQYDTNTGNVEQVYDHHLAAVNTITFCESNRRFATTSDDKKMLVWEFGIPVPIKHIADPTLHSMPAVTKTPNSKWLLCTNLDNKITCYAAQDRFRLNPKKVFRGHIVAGYACVPGVSPDGSFVTSGDSDGRLWVWDWKTGRVFRKIKCHDQVCIQALWHPIEPSRVATCSWDGTIKYWE